MKNKKVYFWGLISKFGPTFLQLLTNIWLARLLTPSDFGTIGVLSVIIMTANVLIDSGLGGSLVKEPVITKKDCDTIATFNIAIGILFCLVLIIFANAIEQYYETVNLAKLVRFLSIMFVIGPVGMVANSLLIKELKFKTICINTIAGTLLSCIMAIYLAYNNWGVYALAIQQISAIAIMSFLNCVACKYFPSPYFSFGILKKFLPFGFFTTLALVIDTFYENILAAMIGKYLDMRQAGFFSQAKKIEEASGPSISKALSVVVFPILTKTRAEIGIFKQESESIYKVIMLLVIPLLLTVAAFSELIMSVIFGSQWIGAAVYLKILMIAGVFLVAESLIRTFIKSLTEVRPLMWNTFIKRFVGIAIIILTLLLDKSYLIYGYVISSYIGFVFTAWLYCRLTKCRHWIFHMKTVCILFPSIAYYLLINVFCTFVNNAIIQIVCTLLLLMIYTIGVCYVLNPQLLLDKNERRKFFKNIHAH